MGRPMVEGNDCSRFCTRSAGEAGLLQAAAARAVPSCAGRARDSEDVENGARPRRSDQKVVVKLTLFVSSIEFRVDVAIGRPVDQRMQTDVGNVRVLITVARPVVDGVNAGRKSLNFGGSKSHTFEEVALSVT